MLLSNTKYYDYNLDTGLKLDIGFLFLVLIINIFSSLSLAMYIYVCFVFLMYVSIFFLIKYSLPFTNEFPTKRGNKRKMKKHFIKDIHLIIVGKCSFISIHQ